MPTAGAAEGGEPLTAPEDWRIVGHQPTDPQRGPTGNTMHFAQPVTAAPVRRRRVVFAFVLGMLGCGSVVPQPTAPAPEKQGERAAKVYRSAQELLADLPKDKYPFGGALERTACQKWLTANVVGRTVEWTGAVESVHEKGEGPYRVAIKLAGRRYVYEFSYTSLGNAGVLTQAVRFGPTFQFDGKHCVGLVPEVGIAPEGYGGFGLRETVGNYCLVYPGCTGDEVKTLRRLAPADGKGKAVVFRATVTAADVTLPDFPARDYAAPREPVAPPPPEPGVPPPVIDPEIDTRPATGFLFRLSTPSADGFIPESCRPKR